MEKSDLMGGSGLVPAGLTRSWQIQVDIEQRHSFNYQSALKSEVHSIELIKNEMWQAI